MITKAIKYLVNQLVENELIEEIQRDEYLYSLECFIEGILTTGSILILAICFRKLIPTIMFLLFFFSLRRRTGGFHLDTFGSCYIGTLILYVLIIISAEYIIREPVLLALLTVCACVSILIIGTVNHPNIDMSKEELKAAKMTSRLLVSLLMMLVGFLWWVGTNMEIIAYMCLGIILCASLLVIAKIEQEVK
ncbi:hypothetical protein E5329_26980 [Petralouisia muris]|uniref:Uncharacterized protein n=1 Tax=Petralouisia muris TaxID=3032872 RepID=A0AC61RMF4_9FIRM|nr:accessory gene regulator B family protein [Petralouisia muris]TGY87132.1 hypothetical protein E5329_26980 [Petralouisia muris]